MEGGSAEYPHKRARLSPPDRGGGSGKANSPTNTEESAGAEGTVDWPLGGPAVGGATKGGQSSSFRNVSACNRCRLRKNRCDQRLPSCATCEKAGVKCVGYDPITKREIPRSYVFYLESRVSYLEGLLRDHNIPFADADVLDHKARPGADLNAVQTPSDDGPSYNSNESTSTIRPSPPERSWSKRQSESDKLNKLVSNIESVTVQGASDSRFLGSASGISFARVVFAAVKSSVSSTNSDKSGVRPSRLPINSKAAGAVATGTGTSMRDSFFGLHTKPTIKQAPFPTIGVGRRLVDFYFEHANPQIPILHRGEFMKMFELAYADGDARVRTSRELYMINMVCAIGSGIFLGDVGEGGDEEKQERRTSGIGKQCQPEEYHASAIVHLEACLSSPNSLDRTDGFGGGLEELQAVLLLAGFALLRPVAPGLWYIIGVAVRLAVDLGLHYEDGKDIDVGLEQLSEESKDGQNQDTRLHRERAAQERGRREWVRDFRRRLWWCTYSFDRLVSTCVGRPFGITDQVVTTEFPSILDDKYITPSGFLEAPEGAQSYKHAAYHYFRFRLLQSEVLQVLQHQQAQVARAGGANQRNPYMHTALPSPFLSKFDGFRSWRMDIDQRLWTWKTSAPTKRETGVGFSVEFLELNYWQCIIMLYRQSLSVPPVFEGEYNTSDEVQSPSVHNVELREDEDRVFLKVAEAGQRVLRLYRQLHRVHLVNYTFLATHHLFMAGISFLYAIWHSPLVRSRLTLDEVDFTILAATSVLGDLIEKCPPAEACRDAFDRMSKATVQMCMSTTGFGSSTQGLNSQHPEREHNQSIRHKNNENASRSKDFFTNRDRAPQRSGPAPPRLKPHFDMGLNDLLSSPPAAALVTTQPHMGDSHMPFQSVTVQPRQTHQHDIKMEFEYGQSPEAAGGGVQSHTTADGQTRSAGQIRSSGQERAADYSMSAPSSMEEGLDTSSIDPSLLPSSNSYQSNIARDTILSPQSYTHDSSYQELQFPNLAQAPGMDFLQGNEWETTPGIGNGLNGGGFVGSGGADFGMGLGLEWEGMEHDFSEGGNGGLDLFEGFFFGGAGNL